MSEDRSRCVRCKRRLGRGATKVCAHGDTHMTIGPAPYAGVLCLPCAMIWSPGFWPETHIPRLRPPNQYPTDNKQIEWASVRRRLQDPPPKPPRRKARRR